MARFNDQAVEYWTQVFLQFERRYRIRSRHAVPFDLFMRDPDANERWIEVYFANPFLFANRVGGGAITLAMFLSEGPSTVAYSVMLIEGMRRESAGLQADEALLPRQRTAAACFDMINGDVIQEQFDIDYERRHVVEHRGNRMWSRIIGHRLCNSTAKKTHIHGI